MPPATDDIKATARRIWAEIIPAGDAAALPGVMRPGCAGHSARPGEPPASKGSPQTTRWLHSVLTGLAFGIQHVIGEGDTVAVHCTLAGRHTGNLMGIPPTGRPVATPMVHILRFRDGKAAGHWAVHDDTATRRQLGAPPARPPHRQPPAQAAG